ncbi:MAG: thioredoxin [Thiovulaceae bacterium]|nr:thioredoxin [Sulfurimonadaceae bacterium]
MAYIDLTTKDFNETLDTHEIVIIDFWAEWCAPCKQFAPTFEKVAAENPDITFAKVNTEEQQAIATQYGIHSVPTLMVVRDGIVLLNHGGAQPEDVMNKVIAHVKSIDMDDIRAQMAKDEEDDE